MTIASLFTRRIALFALLGAVLWSASGLSADETINEVPPAEDLRALGEISQREGLPILIEVAMGHCPWCARLEEEFLLPMLRSGDYNDRVIIRRIDLDLHTPLVDFDGRPISSSDFAVRYGVRLTPTVLLLDGQGRELAEPLVGLTTPDFYGGYLDAAIDESLARLRADQPMGPTASSARAESDAPEPHAGG